MADDLDKQQTERIPRKCFRCGYKDHLIAKLPKPPKDNKKQHNQVYISGKVIMHRIKNLRTVIMIMIKVYMHI